MRLRRLGGFAIVAVAPVALASPAAAVDAVPLPMKGPPGAPVTVTVSSCPTPTTDAAVVRFRVAGGAVPPFNPSETDITTGKTSGGGAEIALTIPIDATIGAHVFDVFCVSEGGSVTGGPTTVPFEVALLPVNVTPGQGPRGTRVTVSGSGCPTGTTDRVFVRIRGAGDDEPPFDSSASNQFSTTPNPDGSFQLSFQVPAASPLAGNSVESFCISEGGSVLAGPGHGLFFVTSGSVSGGELARTGSTSIPLAVGAAMLLLLGFLFVRWTRTDP